LTSALLANSAKVPAKVSYFTCLRESTLKLALKQDLAGFGAPPAKDDRSKPYMG